MRQFAMDLTSGLGAASDNVRVGVVMFSTEAHVVMGLSSDLDDVRANIWMLDFYAGVTNTRDALLLMASLLEAEGRDDVAQVSTKEEGGGG